MCTTFFLNTLSSDFFFFQTFPDRSRHAFIILYAVGYIAKILIAIFIVLTNVEPPLTRTRDITTHNVVVRRSFFYADGLKIRCPAVGLKKILNVFERQNLFDLRNFFTDGGRKKKRRRRTTVGVVR